MPCVLKHTSDKPDAVSSAVLHPTPSAIRSVQPLPRFLHDFVALLYVEHGSPYNAEVGGGMNGKPPNWSELSTEAPAAVFLVLQEGSVLSQPAMTLNVSPALTGSKNGFISSRFPDASCSLTD